MTYADQFARSQDIAGKVTRVFQKRAQTAQQQYDERVRAAGKHLLDNGHASSNGYDYAVDVFQRSILFWDTLRRRGNQFVEQAKRGSEPVLHFEYEMLLDGRGFSRPVNYALLRIVPPQGVVIDDKKRPYLIIDPRAGHGPGIGGFKDDSQVGVALRAGHPVYFVTFFRDPQPGQTLLDVCAAEQRFVKHVRALHPESRKPAIVGNCQGGWAAMMLASSEPDETGPLVINGAPMSYWSGAWSEGEGDNPMRYSGGMLGGTWLASFTADLGNGKFDGAHLVQNFESLNPANSLWDKYYHLYANIDSEPPRFLDFERWWGAYYLMNRDEIEWITRNLFVGNKLWSGEVRGMEGVSFDLRAIKSPIVLFASLGDNITPPQQAFNWVADVYGSTEEIKSRGQVIVGLMHQDIGHLGIFVSGKVAKKEYTQIASVLEAIESFPPGLYGMEIAERKTADGTTEYDVSFREHRLEEVVARFNRFERIDELPFKAVQQVSDFNQRAYELFAQPFVQAMSNDVSATWLRQFHPLRAQRWMVSDMNPWLAWLGPAADAVKAARKPEAAPGAWHAAEHFGSDMLSAGLDFYRAMRDAATESLFFSIYGNMFSTHHAQTADGRAATHEPADPRDLPFVQEALAGIARGGYPEALARVACLLVQHDQPIPFAHMLLRQELTREYAHYVPQMPPDAWRRLRGEQEIVVRLEPEQALATLPELLRDSDERKKLLTFIDTLLADSRVQSVEPTAAQREMLARIRAVLPVQAAKPAKQPRQAKGSAQAH